MKQSIIGKKSFDFAIKVVKIYSLLKKQNEFVISKQLLKSGTSIGANVQEASAAESKKDFIHKMSIASKEARETLYWIKLLNESNLVKIDVEGLLTDLNEIIKILTSIVKTSQSKITQN